MIIVKLLGISTMGEAMRNISKFIPVALGVCIVLGTTGRGVRSEEPAVTGSAPQFEISRMVVATGVENREPVGVADTFPASTEKVYCFIEAANISGAAEVTFVWFHGGKEMRRFSLPLEQGPRWRTFAYKNLHGLTGEWKVDVVDAGGSAVKTLSFRVE